MLRSGFGSQICSGLCEIALRLALVICSIWFFVKVHILPSHGLLVLYVLTTLSASTFKHEAFFGMEALFSLFVERFYFEITSIAVSKDSSVTVFILDCNSNNVNVDMSANINT